MSEAQVEAFPWHALDSLRRSDLLPMSVLRAAAARFVDVGHLSASCEALLGFTASARLRRVSSTFQTREHDTAIVFGGVDESRTFLLELESAAAHRVLAAALGQRDLSVTRAASPLPAEAGALAATLLAVARSTRAPEPPHVFQAGSEEIARVWRDQHPKSFTALFTVILRDEAYDARVSFDTTCLPRREELFDGERLANLGTLPLPLTVVLGSALLSRADLDALEPGDAWMPGLAASSTRALLCAPTGECAFSGTLHPDGTLTFEGKRVELPWSIVVEDLSMSTDSVTAAEVLENAPVVVRVEIGACELSAREWASLRKGDVLPLSQRVGDPVSLRASGVEIARGELVQIEGELGVRILSRHAT